MTALVVIAKACVPGRVKTRLHPPFTLEAAAAIAAASLADTLETARAIAADRRILYFDGDPGGCRHDGFEIVPQPPGTLDERIASLFDRLDEPTLLIGMDTPQFAPADLVWPTDTDAVIGWPKTADSGPSACASRAVTSSAACRCRAPTPARCSSPHCVGAGLTVDVLRHPSRCRPRGRRSRRGGRDPVARGSPAP